MSAPLNVVFVHPDIPPNTGSTIRLAAVTGVQFHVVEPTGFSFDDARLKRAGLDYHEYTAVIRHASLEALFEYQAFVPERCFGFTSKTTTRYDSPSFQLGDWLAFGNELHGLPAEFVERLPDNHRLRLPMLPDRRSINLATSAGIGTFEALRQLDFPGLS